MDHGTQGPDETNDARDTDDPDEPSDSGDAQDSELRHAGRLALGVIARPCGHIPNQLNERRSNNDDVQVIPHQLRGGPKVESATSGIYSQYELDDEEDRVYDIQDVDVERRICTRVICKPVGLDPDEDAVCQDAEAIKQIKAGMLGKPSKQSPFVLLGKCQRLSEFCAESCCPPLSFFRRRHALSDPECTHCCRRSVVTTITSFVQGLWEFEAFMKRLRCSIQSRRRD
mmetsp:Transcript_132652/g.330888  ORF Transcript_132652/g.330888 Transcript_132652/m.330888 type:complete len:228 (-) Transcript_132652:156-839(-)